MKCRLFITILLALLSTNVEAQDIGTIKARDLFDLMEKIDMVNNHHDLVEKHKHLRKFQNERHTIPIEIANSIFASDTIHVVITDIYDHIVGGHQEYVKGSHDSYYYDSAIHEQSIDPEYSSEAKSLLLSILGKKYYSGIPLLENFSNLFFYYELINEKNGAFKYRFKAYLYDSWTHEIIQIKYKDNRREAYNMDILSKFHPD